MKRCKLGDIADIITGPFGSQLHASDYVEKGIPSIMPKDIGDRKVIDDTIAYISEKDAERLAKYRVRLGDIVYSRRGDIERCALIREENVGALCGTGCLRVRPDNNIIDSIFLSFYLSSPEIRKWVVSNATGATMPNLNTDVLSRLPMELPALKVQRRIGTILDAFDKKIALNNHLNATLEAMAKTLYDYWFVQFDFPDEKGRPYKTSGGKMIYNEELGREIPAGWEAGNLGELCTITRGVTYTKDVVSKFPQENYVPILRANNINGKRLNFDSLVYVPKQFISEEQKLNKNDILITMSSGSMEHIGKIARVWDDMPFSFGAFCSKISTKDVAYKNYVYEYLASTEFDAYIHNMCLGTNIRNLTNEYILNTFIPIPPMAILLLQRNLIDKLFDYIGGKEQEIQNLAALRDWLLPMLMNGQVGFKHNGQ